MSKINTKNLLVENRANHIKYILKQCDNTEKDLKEGVATLKKWLKTQRHLPEIPSEEMITCFLVMNRFSIENTKLKLDMYYTIRTILPEVYENKNPKLPNMQLVANSTYIAPLPRITNGGYRVTFIKYLDDNPENFSPYDFFAHGYNVVEVRLQEDIALGDIIVYDTEFLNMGHMLKITPICLKKFIVVLEKVFSNKVKGIHYVNTPPFVNKLASLVKSLLKPKLASRLHVHQSADKLAGYIPKEILPRDYGGDELSLPELNELWKKKLVEYQDRFDALDRMRINEKLRPTPLVNDEVLGFYGNFKKLSVD